MKSGYISDKQNRSQLIESELSSVKKIAYHYYGRIKNAVEIEDLLQIGFLGLLMRATVMLKQSRDLSKHMRVSELKERL